MDMGKELGIRVIAIFSKPDGTVDVMLDCDLLGQVFVKVVRDNNGKLRSNIMDTGETNWGALGSFYGYVSVKVRIRQAGVKAVKHCLAFVDEWVIVGQEDEFDMWALRRVLPVDKLRASLAYKPRFPLLTISSHS